MNGILDWGVIKHGRSVKGFQVYTQGSSNDAHLGF